MTTKKLEKWDKRVKTIIDSFYSYDKELMFAKLQDVLEEVYFLGQCDGFAEGYQEAKQDYNITE